MFNTKEIYEVLQRETKGTQGHQPLKFLVSDPTHLMSIEDGHPVIMRNGPPEFVAKNEVTE